MSSCSFLFLVAWLNQINSKEIQGKYAETNLLDFWSIVSELWCKKNNRRNRKFEKLEERISIYIKKTKTGVRSNVWLVKLYFFNRTIFVFEQRISNREWYPPWWIKILSSVSNSNFGINRFEKPRPYRCFCQHTCALSCMYILLKRGSLGQQRGQEYVWWRVLFLSFVRSTFS